MSMRELKPDIKPDIKPSLPSTDPEEQLRIHPRVEDNKTWAFKVPRDLYAKWEQVKEGGVELGTLVIDNSAAPPKVQLRLPDNSLVDLSEEGRNNRGRLDTTDLPLLYNVFLPPAQSTNTWLFKEKIRTWGPIGGQGQGAKRKREEAYPELISQIQHEGSIRADTNDERYRKSMARRQLESQTSKRPIMQLEDTGLSKGKMNEMASGRTNANSKFGKNTNIKSQIISTREERLPQTQLIDTLFSEFSRHPYWGLSALSKTVKQPVVWVKTCLDEIALPVTEGVYKGQWKLKAEYEYGGMKVFEKREGEGSGAKDEEGGEEEDEFDDEEDDFEEIV